MPLIAPINIGRLFIPQESSFNIGKSKHKVTYSGNLDVILTTPNEGTKKPLDNIVILLESSALSIVFNNDTYTQTSGYKLTLELLEKIKEEIKERDLPLDTTISIIKIDNDSASVVIENSKSQHARDFEDKIIGRFKNWGIKRFAKASKTENISQGLIEANNAIERRAEKVASKTSKKTKIDCLREQRNLILFFGRSDYKGKNFKEAVKTAKEISNSGNTKIAYIELGATNSGRFFSNLAGATGGDTFYIPTGLNTYELEDAASSILDIAYQVAGSETYRVIKASEIDQARSSDISINRVPINNGTAIIYPWQVRSSFIVNSNTTPTYSYVENEIGKKLTDNDFLNSKELSPKTFDLLPEDLKERKYRAIRRDLIYSSATEKDHHFAYTLGTIGFLERFLQNRIACAEGTPNDTTGSLDQEFQGINRTQSIRDISKLFNNSRTPSETLELIQDPVTGGFYSASVKLPEDQADAQFVKNLLLIRGLKERDEEPMDMNLYHKLMRIWSEN